MKTDGKLSISRLMCAFEWQIINLCCCRVIPTNLSARYWAAFKKAPLFKWTGNLSIAWRKHRRQENKKKAAL